MDPTSRKRKDSATPTINKQRSNLQRPLPPLMPLSDPGRDMFASTIALHRASHMLDARNLKSEPLPHPLPPSLHPPAPVDVSDFDIDFIMQGAVDPYGIDSGVISAGGSPLLSGSKDQPLSRSQPTASKLQFPKGREDEDTFAKFVGDFDEEYDDRRGEWTFKALSTNDPSTTKGFDGPVLQWASTGAGTYTITSKVEIVSHTSGSAWKVERVGNREYEIQDVTSKWTASPASQFSGPTPSLVLTPPAEGIILAAKCVHVDVGGVKVLARKKRSPAPPPVRARIESEDSALTAKYGNLFNSPGRVKSDTTHISIAAPTAPDRLGLISEAAALPIKRGRGEKVSFLETRRKSKGQDISSSPPQARDSSKEEKKKERASIGDKIKRSWLGSLSKPSHSEKGHASMDDKRDKRHDKDKEKLDKGQSQSWSGGSSSSSIWSQTSSGLGPAASSSFASKSTTVQNLSPETAYTPPWLLLSESSIPNGNLKSTETERSRIRSESGIDILKPTTGLGIEDETNSGMGWREGRAWKNVPDEALAMVIPLSCKIVPGAASSPHTSIPDNIDEQRPRTADSLGLSSTRALLVYYVPFSSSDDEPLKGQRAGKAASSTEQGLRARAILASNDYQCVLHPMPFKSFRIVGSVVPAADLRSEAELPSWPEWEIPDGDNVSPDMSPAPSERHETKSSGSPNPSVSGPSPTVIAVCHSPDQGVEFVLEGLDRLGLCEGKSAWGPAGYEEWRGSGLSVEGRQVLDLIWTGSVGVLGLRASAVAFSQTR